MSYVTMLNPQSTAWVPHESNGSSANVEVSNIPKGQVRGKSVSSNGTSLTGSQYGLVALDMLSHALNQNSEMNGAVLLDGAQPQSTEYNPTYSNGQWSYHIADDTLQQNGSHSSPQAGDVGQNGSLQQDAVSPEPVLSSKTGLTTSHSFQSGSSLMSPNNERLGIFTEPRNYAPRTSGLPLSISCEPPPKFDLSLAMASQTKGSQASVNTLSVTTAATYNGNDAMNTAIVPFATQYMAPSDEMLASRSSHLNRLLDTITGLPTLTTAMDPVNFPFMEGSRQAVVANHGVVKLKNIPFATRRSEVIAFLGRNSRILNDADEPVHIIMERVTSKTMDAYVEFVTLDDANKAVEKHHQHVLSGRTSRLGDRPVDVELSSQESLMKDLFPLARGIVWNGVTPYCKPFNVAEPWENFKGFVSEEEMIMLVKHVEVPHRSPFSKDCPQRPYECLISTLKKFPWYATEYITIGLRRAVFKATCELARLLIRSIQKQDDPVNLTRQLYRRLVDSAMKCPGFTPLMKDDIAYLADMSEMAERSFHQPRFASRWRHQYSITPKVGVSLDVLEWYIAIIRQQTHHDMLAKPHSERTLLQERSGETDMYWGYFWAELGYVFGPSFDQMTLSQVAEREFSAIEEILSRALPCQ